MLCSTELAEPGGLWLYIECSDWRVIPPELKKFSKHSGFIPKMDQSFYIYAFDINEFSTLNEFQSYLSGQPRQFWGEIKEEVHPLENAVSLKILFNEFGSNWDVFCGVKFEDGVIDIGSIPWDKINGNILDEQIQLIDEFTGTNIYSLLLPGHPDTLDEVKILRRDGNFTEIIGCDKKFWYHFKWGGS